MLVLQVTWYKKQSMCEFIQKQKQWDYIFVIDQFPIKNVAMINSLAQIILFSSQVTFFFSSNS